MSSEHLEKPGPGKARPTKSHAGKRSQAQPETLEPIQQKELHRLNRFHPGTKPLVEIIKTRRYQTVVLHELGALPQRSASQVKNQWADVVREVRKSGSIAVTSHDRVEMVVMDATAYERLTSLSAEQQQNERAALERLTAEFDRRLDALNLSSTPHRVQAVMKARGRAKQRPKAGPSF